MKSSDVTNLPLSMSSNYTTGSTSGNFTAPQGQVMKLDIPNVPETAQQNTSDRTAVFGSHIREAIAIVKDWNNRP
jgi:hypothetical protein